MVNCCNRRYSLFFMILVLLIINSFLNYISSSIFIADDDNGELKNQNNLRNKDIIDDNIESFSYQSPKYRQFLKKLEKPLEYKIKTRNLEKGFKMVWEFTYSPWVLIPPLSNSLKSRNEIITISEYYKKEIAESKALCESIENSDYCINPVKTTDEYHPRNCFIKFNCGNPLDFIVNVDTKYTYGEIAFIENGVIDLFSYECSWKSDYRLLLDEDYENIYYINDTVVYISVPEGYTFHHFSEGILPKLVQAESLIMDGHVKFLFDYKFYHSIVPFLLQRIGIGKERIIVLENITRNHRYLKAATLVMACKAPPLNPYLWRRMQYVLKLPVVGRSRPGSTVYYLQREEEMDGSISNENDVISSLYSFFQRINYEFLVFKVEDDFEKIIEAFSNSFMLIGPHGGAFQNMMFMRSNSTILEFQKYEYNYLRTPAKHIMHRQAILYGHNYYSLVCKPIGRQLHVDKVKLIEMLNFIFNIFQ